MPLLSGSRSVLLLGAAAAALATPLRAQRPATSATAAAKPTPTPLATIYDSERREVGAASAADSLPRVLYVALPLTYGDSARKRYPVVYVLDGDGVFAMASDIERALAIGREIPEVILVGVAHGRPYLQTAPFRVRNFTPTAHATRPGSGRAPAFLAYLGREVVPLVDSLYRTAPGDRTLLTVSLGGLFAAYALYERPELFPRLVMASPAVQRDTADLRRRDTAFAATRRALPAIVYLSVGGAELAQPLGVAAKAFADALAARRYDQLRLTVETLAGETHFSMMGPAITRGLKAVFRDSLGARVAPDRGR